MNIKFILVLSLLFNSIWLNSCVIPLENEPDGPDYCSVCANLKREIYSLKMEQNQFRFMIFNIFSWYTKSSELPKEVFFEILKAYREKREKQKSA